MFRQGSELTDAERRAVAAFLAGRPVGTAPPPSIVGRCTGAAGAASGVGTRERMERVGRRRREHALSTGSEGRSQRGR